MPGWQIKRLTKNTVEILTPSIRYEMQATPTKQVVRAYRGENQIEESSFTRTGHNFTIDTRDERGKTMQLKVYPSKTEITSSVLIGKERFSVDSIASEYAMQLMRALKGKEVARPASLARLSIAMRQDSAFRSNIRGLLNIRGLGIDLPNGVIALCVAICAACALGGVFACMFCAACVEDA